MVKASFDAGRRELAITVEKGTLRYTRVTAVAVTLGARFAVAEWVSDTLPGTLLTEVLEGVPRPEAPRGLIWLHGQVEDFEGAPVRDGLAFTGGRWFRVFVAAVTRSVAPA